MANLQQFFHSKRHFIEFFWLLIIAFVFVFAIAVINRESLAKNEDAKLDTYEKSTEESALDYGAQDELPQPVVGFTAPVIDKQISPTDSLPLTPTQPMDDETDIGKTDDRSTMDSKKKDGSKSHVMCYKLWLTAITITVAIVLVFLIARLVVECIIEKEKERTANLERKHYRATLVRQIRQQKQDRAKARAVLMSSDFPIVHHV